MVRAINEFWSAWGRQAHGIFTIASRAIILLLAIYSPMATAQYWQYCYDNAPNPGKIKSYHADGADYYTLSPTCDHGYYPTNVLDKFYNSVDAWASAINENCNGSNGGHLIIWYPPYEDPLHADYYYMDAFYVGALFTRSAQLSVQCTYGYYLSIAQPPNLLPSPSSALPVPDLGDACSRCKTGTVPVGHPIDPGSGNEFESHTDFVDGRGRLRFVRSYNSEASSPTSMGLSWQHNFSSRIRSLYNSLPADASIANISNVYGTPADACVSGWPQISAEAAKVWPSTQGATASYDSAAGTCNLSTGQTIAVYNSANTAGTVTSTTYVPGTYAALVLTRADGSVYDFYCINGVCQTKSDVPLVLTVSSSGYVLRDEFGNTETYNDNGDLTSIIDKDGYTQTLAYSGGSLQTVTDSYGRTLTFTYQNSLLHSVTEPDTSQIVYGYDSTQRLETVTYPDSGVLSYKYVDGVVTDQLWEIIDENEKTYATFSYDADGKANGDVLAGGAGAVSIVYNSDNSATITDALGAVRTFTYQIVQGRPKIQAITGAPCPQCAAGAATVFDNNGYLEGSQDWNGNITAYTYDDAGLEAQRIEAQGTSAQRTINTQWDDVLRNPLDRQVLDASDTLIAKTDWMYNARGQALAHCEYDPTVSGATDYVCTNTGTPPAGVRRWTYIYCDVVDGSQCPLVGLLLSVDGPRTDVSDLTQYTYYPTTDESGCGTAGGACHRAGDLWKTTDALGHVVETVAYDKNGRVARSKDANGVITDLTYTPRGWLHTRTVRANADGSPSVQDAPTTIDYYPVGTVKQVTQPDGVYTHYDYDDAHRLTRITDALGNYIQYTLDAAGNRTEEDTYAVGSSTPSHTLSRHFNTLGEMDKAFDAYMQATSFLYDPNGNRTDATDPKTITTHSDYDPLNRLSDTIQNYQGSDPATQNTTTGYQYDSQDNLTQVTDPDTLITRYTYDGLSDLGQLQSPDTGTSHYTYDAAGNRMTQTDAKTVLTTYGYDALNRLTSISYPTSTLNIHYYYDEPDSTTGCTGSYPVGRLTRMTGSSGSTAYCYDQRGNVVAKLSTIGTVPATTRYSYNLADRLVEVDYPGNQADVVYARDADGRIASVSNGSTPIVTAIGYLPFGPATQYSFAGGQILNKAYDANYHATDITGGNALNLHFKLDALGDISAEGDASGVPTPNESYQYDPLYRLQEVDDATGAPWQNYTYSKTGDRLSKATAAQSPVDTYSYTPGTHHLIGISGYDASSRAVNANGNTSAFQANGWMYGLGYNDTNRLSLVQQNGTTIVAYRLDGKGERVRKLLSGATPIEYVYDEAGRLLYEYTGPSQNRAYIWADNTLVATVEDNATIHYVYTDHLGTPRAITTTTSDTPIWTWPWLQNPFGEQPASGAGGYTFNLRYPGQYYDSETGLSYNYFRDYEPGTGRYGESDPMGLAAGANTYSYVGTDPLSYIDPFGLDETRIVNTSGGRSVWDGPTNGNWGGKCWSGGQYSCGGRPMGNAPPTDSADRCYMHHDNCYDKCNGNVECMEACNKELIKELHNLPDDPTKWPQPPRRGTERDSRTYRAGAFLLWGH